MAIQNRGTTGAAGGRYTVARTSAVVSASVQLEYNVIHVEPSRLRAAMPGRPVFVEVFIMAQSAEIKWCHDVCPQREQVAV